MADSNQQLRKALTVSRLLKLINEMSIDKQAALLKQLLAGEITSHLMEIVSNMTYDQQLALLQQLDEMPPQERPIKTIRLDGEETFMRGHLRKSCLIAVDYTIQGQSYKGYILDISSLGVFIETRIIFPVGEMIEIFFTLPDYDKPFSLNAEIAWSGRYGIGVKFDTLTVEQENAIRSFVEKDEDL